MSFERTKGMLFTIGFGIRKAANTGGDLVRAEYNDVWVNPNAIPTNVATCDLVTSVAAPTGAGGLDFTIVAAVAATLAAIPRSLAIWADAAMTQNCVVTGFDQFGTAQAETVAFNGAAKVETTTVWGSLTSIHSAQRSGAGNLGVGLGSIFGTSRKLVKVGSGIVYVTATGKYAAVRETTTPVKSTTASVHGVTWTTAIAATNTYELAYISDEAR
jgi:hypothetical protein